SGTVIPATENHNYVGVETRVPTCKDKGIRTYTCSVCGDSYEDDIPVNANNHAGGTEVRNAVTGNCGEAGYTGDTYCLGCNVMLTEGEEIPATENHHYESEITSESTCAVAGIRTYTCSVCNDSYTEELELSDEHTWGEPEVIEDATCTTDGYKAIKCTVCGEVLEDGIILVPSSEYPESDHDYQNNINTTYYFSYPGATRLHLKFSEECALETGCDYLDVYDGDGYRIKRYTGYSLAGEEITIDGDSFSLTLRTDAIAAYYGFSFTKIEADMGGAEIIPATGHNYSSEITSESTCIVAGIRTYTCSACNDSYTEELELSDEHTWGEPEIVQEATCTEDGYKAKICSECGELYTGFVVVPSSEYPESDHNYHNNTDITYYFSYPGATSLRLTFSEECEFESGDYLYFYYSDYDYLIGSYTGHFLSGREFLLSCDSFSLRLSTDGSYTAYGFSFAKIEAEIDGVAEVIPATGHDYSSVITSEATCCDDGVITYTCANCSDTYTETIESDPDAHDMSEWEVITEPTCNTEGRKVRKCAECGYVSLSRITLDEYTYPESDHDYLNNENKDYTIFGYEGADKLYLTFSSSTYFEDGCDYLFIYDGSGDYIGRYTGNSLAGKTITIPGDSFSLRLETDDSFTCYGFSFDSIVAEVSDGSADYVSIPATGNHDYVYSTTREATCSREGEITYTCSDCGDSYTESTGRTAHTPGDWQIITGATADTDGMKIRCCTVCGTETDRETIPAGTGVTRYLGDASGDGKVTAADARLILRHSARIEILSDNMIRLADVNSDGKVNASDARIALRTASKLEGLIIYG
ncbi:MAG: hypothetical protein IJ289_09455, partial [Clostridia bacterium]|nr:hypothetical protein [Clostridia bacterium]